MEHEQRVVPWFSMSEWELVFKLLYSEKIEDQERGVEHLRGWKVRCNSLSRHIECTLVIFHVILKDPCYNSGKVLSVEQEYDLRIMYSTAVMRFLNLMLETNHFDRDPDEALSFYTRAERVNIPQWIVSLRHSTSHGTSMPDLGLFRTAATSIKKWLKENYWEHENKLYQDWYLTKEDVIAMSVSEGELVWVLEVWEALNVYKVAGFINLEQLPDKKLEKSVLSIRNMLSSSEEQDLVEGEEAHMHKKKKPTSLTTSLKIVLLKLRQIFQEWSNRRENFSAVVANVIVAGNFLLPSENLLKQLGPKSVETQSTLQQLPEVLVQCCGDLLSTLWNFGCIPELTNKLVSLSANPNESGLRRNVAALWIQKIFLSCLKVRESSKLAMLIDNKMDCTKTVKRSLVIEAIEAQRPDLKLGYRWNLHEIPETLTSIAFVTQCVYPPSKFTRIFLPSVMELTSPCIRFNIRQSLLDVINVYCDGAEGLVNITENKIFSIDDIQNESIAGLGEAEHNDSVMSESSRQELCPSPIWSLSLGIDWQNSPLGILPWQQGNSHHEEKPTESNMLWSKLFSSTKWNHDMNEECGKSEDRVFEADFANNVTKASLSKVKKGRVDKPYIKQLTPLKVFTTLRRNKSLTQKADEFLACF